MRRMKLIIGPQVHCERSPARDRDTWKPMKPNSQISKTLQKRYWMHNVPKNSMCLVSIFSMLPIISFCISKLCLYHRLSISWISSYSYQCKLETCQAPAPGLRCLVFQILSRTAVWQFLDTILRSTADIYWLVGDHHPTNHWLMQQQISSFQLINWINLSRVF